MPSSAELPTIKGLIEAFHTSVGSERKTEDAHLGSFYDRMGGIGALCMRQLAERDQGEARAIFFDTAKGDRLDDYVLLRYGIEVPQDTAGVGQVSLTRANAAAGLGTIVKGTRFGVTRGSHDTIRYWSASADIPVDATGLTATVPIVASSPGPSGQVALASGQGATLSVSDPLWDNTWQVARIDCAAGTLRQQDPEIRAGVRQGQADSRVGYPVAIVAAMVAAGASVVALYQGDYLGDALDFGLNRIYVGDAGYETPSSLLTACRLAVPNVCVAGTSVQILPMANQLLYLQVTVRLWASPEKLNQSQAKADAADAVVEYFARRDNAFIWSHAAMRAAVMKVVPNVHSVTTSATIKTTILGVESVVGAPEPDRATLFNSSPLPRYSTADWAVAVTILGPT